MQLYHFYKPTKKAYYILSRGYRPDEAEDSDLSFNQPTMFIGNLKALRKRIPEEERAPSDESMIDHSTKFRKRSYREWQTSLKPLSIEECYGKSKFESLWLDQVRLEEEFANLSTTSNPYDAYKSAFWYDLVMTRVPSNRTPQGAYSGPSPLGLEKSKTCSSQVQN